jgi:hypothetical protein
MVSGTAPQEGQTFMLSRVGRRLTAWHRYHLKARTMCSLFNRSALEGLARLVVQQGYVHPSGCNKAVCRCAVCFSVAPHLTGYLPPGSSH